VTGGLLIVDDIAPSNAAHFAQPRGYVEAMMGEVNSRRKAPDILMAYQCIVINTVSKVELHVHC
jgi:hypothetical protein